MVKRYAVWSKKHDINLFKNNRTFKSLPYAKRVLLNQSQFVNDETLYVKEITIKNDLEKIPQLEKENTELRKILNDFLTTEVCSRTWIDEMRATIDDVLNGDK